ncbi:MAG: hypothetical protein P4L46_17505 [Fimbriimonas sp.]|nr:hypothetical protein [Fimbriimonas sp.]
MSTPLTALHFAAFNLGGTDLLAVLKSFSFEAVNEQADAGGLADRYSIHQAVKQSQKAKFTVHLPGTGGLLASNLDITLWTIGGTGYLGTIRRGVIRATTTHKDGSGIADAYAFPNATRTSVEVHTEKLIVTSAPFLDTLLTGSASSFDLTAAISFAGTAFSCPMSIQSGKHTVDRDEMQMEEVVLTLAGTPTGPSDSSLLGNMLLGTALVTLSANTGGGTYATGSGQTGLLTELTTTFQNASLIEQTGELAIQGGAAWSS